MSKVIMYKDYCTCFCWGQNNVYAEKLVFGRYWNIVHDFTGLLYMFWESIGLLYMFFSTYKNLTNQECRFS